MCDCDPPEFYNRSDRTKSARGGPRECFECNAPIEPGDRYVLTTGKWASMVESFSTCLECAEIIQHLTGGGHCVCHGELAQVLHDEDMTRADVLAEMHDAARASV